MLDPSWRNLAAGHDLAVRLEAALRERWCAPIEQAERRALHRATEAWSQARAAEQRRWKDRMADRSRRNAAARARFAEQHAAWQRRDAAARQELDAAKAAWLERETARRSAFQRLHGEWSAEHAVLDRRLRGRAAIALASWLAVGLAGLLLGPLSAAHLALAGLATVAAALASSRPLRDVLSHRALCPEYATDDREPVMSPAPEPRYPGDEPSLAKPGPGRAPKRGRRDVSLELAVRWWSDVRAAERGAGRPHAHGDDGVSLLLDALSRRLSDDHLVARDLLVRDKLDVDVLVVAPSGVWVLEVKHWSGRIVCRQGDWRRERTYFAAGGIEETEVKPLRPFDRQWQREVEAVTQTLSRRLKPPIASAAAVRGGLVFSHSDAQLDLDGSCTAAYGSPAYWVEEIARKPPLPGFGMREQLRVLDALFARSRKLEGGASSVCAERRASELHEQTSAAAEGYVRRLDAG